MNFNDFRIIISFILTILFLITDDDEPCIVYVGDQTVTVSNQRPKMILPVKTVKSHVPIQIHKPLVKMTTKKSVKTAPTLISEATSLESAREYKSTSGCPRLIVDDFLFVNGTERENTLTWKCSKFRSLGCNCEAITFKKYPGKARINGAHNHSKENNQKLARHSFRQIPVPPKKSLDLGKLVGLASDLKQMMAEFDVKMEEDETVNSGVIKKLS